MSEENVQLLQLSIGAYEIGSMVTPDELWVAAWSCEPTQCCDESLSRQI